MSALPEDALTRYTHVRGELAAIDAKLQAMNLQATVHQGVPDDTRTSQICELLADQADASTAFAEAAEQLGHAFSA